MARTLLRPCLDCGQSVRGWPRCRDCDAKRDRAKATKRPDQRLAAEVKRKREAVTDHRHNVGDWCPGVPELGRGAHPTADLVADHVTEVAAGGAEDGPLVVRCRSCNSARSANIRRTGSPIEHPATPPAPPNLATQTAEQVLG